MTELLPPPSAPEAAEWMPLHLPWQPAAAARSPRVRWWQEAGLLVWEIIAPLPLAARDQFKTGGFVEGLWTQDVAEFFIADCGTGTYTEYNLSPGGAWWGACFGAPRVRVGRQPVPCGVQTMVTWLATHWIGRMSFPLPDLEGSAVNFTAITAAVAGRQYYSLAPLQGDRPDFHRPQEWLKAKGPRWSG